MWLPDLQAPVNLTRVQRPEWRELQNLVDTDFPWLVRLMVHDKPNGRLVVIGSGSAIGLYKDRWLIVASARHVFENLGKELGHDYRPPWLSMLASQDEELEERFDPKLRQLVYCGICAVPGGEYICRAYYDIPRDGKNRDTAVVFVDLPAPIWGKVQLISVDVWPPPNAFCPVLVAGFSHEVVNPRRLPGAPPVEVGERRPKVREGYIGVFGPRPGAIVRTSVVQVLIQIAPRMSGGGLVIHRWGAVYPQTLRVLVGVVNADRREDGLEASGDGYCSAAINLWTHEILLPDENRWIWFYEAMAQGIISTHGAGAHHVRVVNGNVMVDFTGTGELPTAKAFGWKTGG